MPVSEAMAYGVPVVTSRGTSMEEVAAGAAVLVDPLDDDDMARGRRAIKAGRAPGPRPPRLHARRALAWDQAARRDARRAAGNHRR